MAEETEAEVVARLAQKPFIEKVGQTYIAFIPQNNGCWLQSELDDDPEHIAAKPTFDSLLDLAQYVQRFKRETTVLFCHRPDRAVSAVIDYHGAVGPCRCEHVASWHADADADWAAWERIDGRSISQLEFVRFLEEHLHNITEPNAADVLEVCANLEAIKKVEFRSGARLSNGTRQLVYVEDTQVKGQLTVPEKLTLQLPIFYGQDPSRVEVFLRWPIEDGKLKFKIDIHRLEHVMDEAWSRVVSQAAVQLPEVPIFQGCP